MAILDFSTTHTQVTDFVINVSNSNPVKLSHDIFYNKAGKLVTVFTGTVNLISCDSSANKTYIHDGITSTTTSDFASPGSNISGIAIDPRNNLYNYQYTGYKRTVV